MTKYHFLAVFLVTPGLAGPARAESPQSSVKQNKPLGKSDKQVQIDLLLVTMSRSELRQGPALGDKWCKLMSPETELLRESKVDTLQGTTALRPSAMPSNLCLSIIDGRRERAFLRKLQKKGLANPVAKFSVTALDGRPLKLSLDGRASESNVSGANCAVHRKLEPTGKRIELLPLVFKDGKIYLEVEAEICKPNEIDCEQVPGWDVQRTRLSILLDDGQSFIIGGLIEHHLSRTVEKTSCLADLPFVGEHFQTIRYNETETEVVVFVTPHIVNALPASEPDEDQP